jgi:hypothetical protein
MKVVGFGSFNKVERQKVTAIASAKQEVAREQQA